MIISDRCQYHPFFFVCAAYTKIDKDNVSYRCEIRKYNSNARTHTHIPTNICKRLLLDNDKTKPTNDTYIYYISLL